MTKALILLLLAAPQEWSRFRGPNGSGLSEAKGLPAAWSESDILWRIDLPGQGHSQPVVWEDKLFVTTAKDEGRERGLLAIDKATGRTLWSKSYPMSTHGKHKLNSFASSSPAVDKDRVYAAFVSTEQFVVRAYDHAGKELWAAPVSGGYKSQHGYGASPAILDEKLIVTNDQDGESFIVALDLKSGRTLWKSPRRNTEQSAAYGTPCLHQGQILTTSGTHGIAGLDPKTGRQLWEAKVFDKRAVSSPVVLGGLVFGSCGSGGGGNYVAAVKLGGKGDVTSTHKAYEIRKAAPYVPTPVGQGDRLYLTADNGIASCVEASSGRVIWSERIADGFYGSPVLAEGRVYVASTKGELVVFAAADEFKVLARNSLGEGSHSTPVIDGGRLFIRTFTKLLCVGK